MSFIGAVLCVYVVLQFFELVADRKRLFAAELSILKLESKVRILETEAWIARGLTPAQIASAGEVDAEYVRQIALALRPTLSEERSRLLSALSARKDPR